MLNEQHGQSSALIVQHIMPHCPCLFTDSKGVRMVCPWRVKIIIFSL